MSRLRHNRGVRRCEHGQNFQRQWPEPGPNVSLPKTVKRPWRPLDARRGERGISEIISSLVNMLWPPHISPSRASPAQITTLNHSDQVRKTQSPQHPGMWGSLRAMTPSFAGNSVGSQVDDHCDNLMTGRCLRAVSRASCTTFSTQNLEPV
jgi:hypothetical protein